MLSLGALLLTAWFGEPLSASDGASLSVDVAPELRCPSDGAVFEALETQLAPMPVVRSKHDRQHFHLTLRPYGDHGVVLTLYERTARLADRTLEAKGTECQGLAQAVALITATWTKSARASDPPQGAPAPDVSAPVPMPPVEDSKVAPVPPHAERSDQTSRGAAPPPRFDPVLPALAPAIVDEAPARAPVAQPVPEPAPAPSEEPAPRLSEEEAPAEPTRVRAPSVPAAYRLRVEAAGGMTVSLANPALPTITGRLGVEGARNRWLLGVRGHVESSRTHADAVTVRHSQFDIVVGAELVRSPRWHGAALTGGGVDVTAARAPDYDNNQASRSASPIGLVALRAGMQPRPELDVFAASELIISFRRERFESEGALIAETARARARLLFGVSWHVF